MLLAMKARDRTRKIGAASLMLLWFTALVATTVEGPFVAPGNGFFSMWFGFFAICALGLDELSEGKPFPGSVHFHAAVVYASAGLLLSIESSQFLHFSGEFVCVSPVLHVEMLCSASLAHFAFGYGISTLIVGTFLLLLLLTRIGNGIEAVPCLAWLGPCLHMMSSNVLDGPTAVVLNIYITPLRCLASTLVCAAVALALALTYYFTPYNDFGNGYASCWLSVVSAVVLLWDEPPEAVSSSDPLAVVTTISGDMAAAELGVPSHHESAADMADAPASVERKSDPPLVTALSLASLLVIIAALHRLSTPAFAVTAEGVSDFNGEAVFAILCSSLTIGTLLLRGALLYMKPAALVPHMGGLRVVLMILIVTMWGAAALILTFVGPFLDPGNGYWATWTALVCAFLQAMKESAAASREKL
jgi:hypothetical protein